MCTPDGRYWIVYNGEIYNYPELKEALLEVDGVCGVHDLHVWTITSGFDSLTAHLILEDGARHQDVLDASHRMLVDRFGLDHSTLQPEESGLVPCGDPARTAAALAAEGAEETEAGIESRPAEE